MVRTMYLRRCFYKASLEAETLTFLSRCVRVSFCASSAENILNERTGMLAWPVLLLSIFEKHRDNAITKLWHLRYSQGEYNYMLAMCIPIW